MSPPYEFSELLAAGHVDQHLHPAAADVLHHEVFPAGGEQVHHVPQVAVCVVLVDRVELVEDHHDQRDVHVVDQVEVAVRGFHEAGVQLIEGEFWAVNKLVEAPEKCPNLHRRPNN